SELALAARGYMGVAVSLYDSGELDGAISNYERALQLFERVSDTSFELMVTQSLAAVHLERGDIAAARDLAQRALERGRAVGDDHWAAVAQVVLARVALVEGRAEDALATAEHAERALSVAGDDLQRGDALRVIGAAHDALGRAAESEQSYRASMALLEHIGDLADLSAVAAEFAQRLRARGKLEEAFEMLERSHGAVKH
ncbi:MAG: tetratricopeptide repeat protein, partial [Actinobacteria bacterium]|nr:tetratricopeptide repeat protein [Actinomycetota bacterium]